MVPYCLEIPRHWVLLLTYNFKHLYLHEIIEFANRTVYLGKIPTSLFLALEGKNN